MQRRPISVVLEALSKQGGFIFSYNSDLFDKDSIVSVNESSKPLRQVLYQLLGGAFEYREKKNYVIIQPVSEWEVRGYVLDKETGIRLANASVYEPQGLVASLTNDEGYFKLKLRNTQAPQYITIRKMSYGDTSVMVRVGDRQELLIPISTRDYTLDSIIVRKHKGIENTWLGRIFVSSKEKMQSMNLAGFFVDKPYQVSVIPGVGTHGKMSAQVENNVSFNLLGGYTAGVNGVELGGLFNLVKNNIDGVQIGGLFNTAGGKISGVQIAGLYNQSVDSVNGFQAAGLANVTQGSVDGVQIGGLYNGSAGDVSSVQIAGLVNISGGVTDGLQISGGLNYTRESGKGIQISGGANITSKDFDGVQISGLFNYAKKLKGMQIGLINYADSSSGISLGLINIVPNGYHKATIYTTELIQFNAAFKSGTNRLYTIWLGGFNPGDDKKVAAYGYGLGTRMQLAKWVSINPEITTQQLYLGDWEYTNFLNKASLFIHVEPVPFMGFFAGASYNVYYTEQTQLNEGFLNVDFKKLNAGKLGDQTWAWFGWTAGISFF